MARIAPYIQPAQDERVYDRPRISSLTIQQGGVGQPLSVSYTIAYYSDEHGDAPASSQVPGRVQFSMAAIASMPNMLTAIEAITAAILEQAVQSGVVL